LKTRKSCPNATEHSKLFVSAEEITPGRKLNPNKRKGRKKSRKNHAHTSGKVLTNKSR
jgi:hypothetical protein